MRKSREYAVITGINQDITIIIKIILWLSQIRSSREELYLKEMPLYSNVVVPQSSMPDAPLARSCIGWD